MCGIGPEPSEEERAHHEAGHVVVAYVLRHSFPEWGWATILIQGTNGGNCMLGRFEGDAEDFVAMCWGGVSAEFRYLGLSVGEQRKADGLPTDDAWEESFREEHKERFVAAGSGDLELMERVLGDIAPEHRAWLKEIGSQLANDLIKRCWDLVVHIARELMEHKTLYYDEAFRSLEAYESGLEEGLRELREYRAARLLAPEPEGWNGRGPWFESFATWSARQPR